MNKTLEKVEAKVWQAEVFREATSAIKWALYDAAFKEIFENRFEETTKYKEEQGTRELCGAWEALSRLTLELRADALREGLIQTDSVAFSAIWQWEEAKEKAGVSA